MVDPTNDQTSSHPLTYLPGQRKERRDPTPEETNTDKVIIVNRPRFTPAEALLLNLLVNSHPNVVTYAEIIRYITPVCYVQPRESTVGQHLTNLRAKLGEPKWQPRQIVTVYRYYRSAVGRQGWHAIGVRWVLPGEKFNNFLDSPDV